MKEWIRSMLRGGKVATIKRLEQENARLKSQLDASEQRVLETATQMMTYKQRSAKLVWTVDNLKAESAQLKRANKNYRVENGLLKHRVDTLSGE